MEWSQVTAVYCHVTGRAQTWPYKDEEEDVWMPAKGHTTVKDTLCNWVKWKRILGELKENCKALNSQPVKASEISWAYSPRIPSSVISKCQRCAWGLPFSWNSLFFETQIWVPGAEGSCIMLWLRKLDLSRDHNTVASYQPLLRVSLCKVPYIITRPDGCVLACVQTWKLGKCCQKQSNQTTVFLE